MRVPRGEKAEEGGVVEGGDGGGGRLVQMRWSYGNACRGSGSVWHICFPDPDGQWSSPALST